MIRAGAAGLSILGVVGAALVSGAGPATAPIATPIATPMTAPVVAPPTSTVQPQLQDQNTDRGNRFGRNRSGGRSSNGGGGGSTGRGYGPAIAATNPYAILDQRSIFIKGNQNIAVDTTPRPPERPRTAYTGIHENQLIFNGVTIVNDHPEAFVEDLRSNVVGTVKIGDSVAGGTVAAINFDDLAYLVDGKVRHVGLGDDFTGNTAFSSVAVTPTTGPAALSEAGRVVGNGASIPAAVAAPSGLSSEDILARMKAKRAQEAQQIGK
jgi:hypothetical protein